MRLAVEHWESAEEGALSEAALRRKLERRGYLVSRYVYSPGTRFAEHVHDVEKTDAGNHHCRHARAGNAGRCHG